jgi:hypothetical protein
VIVSEIFEYGLVDTTPYLKRVTKINGEEILNIDHLYRTIQSLTKQGAQKALLEITENVQLPVDLAHAPALDKEIQEKYGILYMRTPGEFTNSSHGGAGPAICAEAPLISPPATGGIRRSPAGREKGEEGRRNAVPESLEPFVRRTHVTQAGVAALIATGILPVIVTPDLILQGNGGQDACRYQIAGTASAGAGFCDRILLY